MQGRSVAQSRDDVVAILHLNYTTLTRLYINLVGSQSFQQVPTKPSLKSIHSGTEKVPNFRDDLFIWVFSRKQVTKVKDEKTIRSGFFLGLDGLCTII